MEKDILQELKNEDLDPLRDLYLENWPRYIHPYMFIENCLRIKMQNPKVNIQITSPNGNWIDGTFIAIITEKTYSLAISTRDKSCDRLVEALTKTKRIDWMKGPYIYTIHEEIQEPCLNVLRNLKQSIDYEVTSQCLWLPKEKALKLKIDLPSGFNLQPLQPKHGSIIFTHWTYKFPEAEQYLINLIKISDGFGVFEKSSGNLCSWVLINEYGVFGVLHTVEEYQRKKLALQVVKHMALHRAKMDLDCIANVAVQNYISENLFYSIGFEKVHNVKWVQFKK